MKTIITIQHTQSLQHTNGMIGSWTDWDLTDLGVEQAKRIGQRLSAELGDARFAMHSSDLLRARRTAQIVAGYLGIEPACTEALREFNLGEAVGQTKAWASQRRLPWNTVDDRPYAGAESKRDVWARLSAFLGQVMAAPDENVIVVSHGGALSVFYALWLGLDVTMLNRCDLRSSAGGVSFLQEDKDGKRVIARLNDLFYIRP